MSALALLQDLAEHEAALSLTFPSDTTAGHVNRAYHVGRTEAFRWAAQILESEAEPTTPPMEPR